ncbi:MAG: formylglycine-generating enzyme family protein [Neisseria sp.]|nr:formylglycine-generating enzyme family protein [Neisseria sp.]
MNRVSALFIIGALAAGAAQAAPQMADISGGKYRPLYLNKDTPLISVKPYKLDKFPITNREFAEFVGKNPQWQRGKVSSKQSDSRYLQQWTAQNGRFAPKTEDLDKPVTNVSWFAANAYCRAQGKHLPTINQWEFAGRASRLKADGSQEASYRETILNWYAEGSSKGLKKVGSGKPNYWGVYDMHGLIWEWTEDFNSSLLNSGGVDASMFCSGAAAGAADPGDYAAFLRYGFRTSLQAKFAVHNLGFRCAQ